MYEAEPYYHRVLIEPMSVIGEYKIDFTGDTKRAGDYHQRHDDRDYNAPTISGDDNIDDDDVSDTEPSISQLLLGSIRRIDVDYGDIGSNSPEHKDDDAMSTGSDSESDDSTSSTSPSPSHALSNSSHLLRVATLNIGQGMRTKLPRVLQWATTTGIHVLALQETGSCPHDHSLLRHFGYHMILSPHHSAGVALILRDDVSIRCVEELDGGRAGRLVGAVIQTTVGNNILFVCAYMPTGMDRAADDGDKARECHRLYDKIITWSNEAGRLTGGKVVVLGDLNETITDADRETRSQGVRHSRFIAKLISANFIDTYRTLHPHRGWTCTTPLDQGRVARSRIDFVLTSGFTPNKVMAARVISAPTKVRTSHHSLLVDLTCDIDVHEHQLPSRPRLPNMRTASWDDKDAMTDSMHEWVTDNRPWILTKANGSGVI